MASARNDRSLAPAELYSLVSKDPELSAYRFVNEPDSELCRSILERTDYNAERAAQELRRYLGLRKECELILQCYSRESLRKAAENKTILLVPGGVSAVGSVLVFRVGAWDPLVCSLPQISALLSFILESLSLDTKVAAKGFSVIFDLKGISLKQLGSMSPNLIKRMKTIANVYLPIQCQYQLVTNAPFPKIVSMFFGLTSFIKNAKNDVYPTSQEALEQMFGADFVHNLPVEYGGKAKYDWYENVSDIIGAHLDKLA